MDGKYFIALLVASTAVLAVLVFFIVQYILRYTRVMNREKQEKGALVFEHQQHLFEARLDERERTMERLSRELHDDASQQVDFIQMNLKAWLEENDGAAGTKYIRTCQQLAEQVAGVLRHLSYALSSEYLARTGLVTVLKKEAGYVTSVNAIRCEVVVVGHYEPLPPEQELLLHRIAQEALHNAVKHAAASEIRIQLSCSANRVLLEIVDDGIGFDAANPAFQQGLGIKNMQQRAALLNSRFEILSLPKQGCIVRLEVAV